jgi:hypothetical protein
MWISKLSTACCALRMLKQDILIMVYCTHFLSLMNYGIIFWGNSSYSNKVFKLKKRVVRIITSSVGSDSCYDLFKNLKIFTLPSQYMFLLLCFVITPFYQYMFNSEINGRSTRQITNFHQPISNLSLYKKGILNMGIKSNNNLPCFIKRTLDNNNKFKSLLRNILYFNPFCKLDEYFNHNTSSWWLYISILAIAV